MAKEKECTGTVFRELKSSVRVGRLALAPKVTQSPIRYGGGRMCMAGALGGSNARAGTPTK